MIDLAMSAWYCVCGTANWPERDVCRQCNVPRDMDTCHDCDVVEEHRPKRKLALNALDALVARAAKRNAKRVHPMDNHAYTYEEFVHFAASHNQDPDVLWAESVEVTGNTNFGNWSGVVSSDIVINVAAPCESSFTEHKQALVRSFSEGMLRENGNSTLRHVGGHPTASGLGWVAAT